MIGEAASGSEESVTSKATRFPRPRIAARDRRLAGYRLFSLRFSPRFTRLTGGRVTCVRACVSSALGSDLRPER